MNTKRLVIASLVLLTLAGSACSQDPADTQLTDPPIVVADPPVPGDGPAPPSNKPEVPSELEFEATLLGGGKLKGADLAGKDIAIWFWAPW